MTEHKLVNGVMMPVEPKPEKPAPKGTKYTEVRLRQFYEADNGMIIMPTLVYFFKDGKPDADMEVGALAGKLVKDISDQLPFPIKAMEPEAIAEELAKEISVGSITASQGKASLGAFAKELPAPTKTEEPPKASNDNEPAAKA
jgi:hypothetical protein